VKFLATSNKPFDFGSDPGLDQDPGIFSGILTVAGIGPTAASAALAEVCTNFSVSECF